MDLRTNSDFSLYIINRLVFIIEAEIVHSAVRTETLYNTDTSHTLTFRRLMSIIVVVPHR